MFRNIRLIFFKEMRDTMRDRRTVFVMLILPIILYPVLMLGMTALTSMQVVKIAREKFVVEVWGMQNSARFMEFLENANTVEAALPENASNTKTKKPALNLDINISNKDFDPDKSEKEITKLIRSKDIRAALIIPNGFEQLIAGDGNTSITIYFDKSDERSESAQRRLAGVVRKFNNLILGERKKKLGLPDGFLIPVRGQTKNVSSKEQLAGRFIGPMLALLLISMAFTGAFYPAIDISAGEKERGTMETLLVSPAERRDIVLGKYLTVFTISIATAVLNIAAMAITFSQLFSMMPEGGGNSEMAFSISPMIAFWMFVVLLPLAGFFSGICLALSTFARSFKEGQNYLSPAFLVVMLLSMSSILPGMEITIFSAAIPITGTSLLFKALLVGTWAWYHVAIVFASNLFFASIAISSATNAFNKEEILFRTDEELNLKFWTWRRFEPFPTKIEGAMVLMAAFALNFFVTARLLKSSPALALIAAFIVAFLALPIVVAKLLKLDLKNTFRLGIPHVADMGLTIIISVAAIFTAMAVNKLQEVIFVDSKAIEESANKLGDFFSSIRIQGLFVTFFVFAILPAFCEEFLFRGFLLKSFEKDWPKWKAILLCGVLFGFIHLNPHQFFYATTLGVAFAVLVLRTGSIWPAIFCHLVVNSSSVLLNEAEFARQFVLSAPVVLLIGGPVVLITCLALTGRFRKSLS